MTAGTVATNKISIDLPELSESPELMARLEAIRIEMPDLTLEQILARVITQRMVDHLRDLAA